MVTSTVLAADAAAGGLDGSDLWGLLGFLLGITTGVVAIVRWFFRDNRSTSWKRAADLRAAALEVASGTPHPDPVVEAAAHLQRRVVLEKVASKQTPLLLPWVIIVLGAVVVVLAAVSRELVLFFIGSFYMLGGYFVLLTNSAHRRRLILLHTGPSPLDTAPARASKERIRRRVHRQLDKQGKRACWVEVLEAPWGQKGQVWRIWRRAAKAFKARG
ncbi:hypothetical protein [Galactobacter valiniphilus]|uniref:hypothetical protein n=1 Tax=Galactobacter valiniphilus TaxID=2676122 RepID=UPI003735F2F4